MLMPATVISPDASSESGVVNVASDHSVPESIDRLESLARSKGLTVFARIDFSGDAAQAGLEMPAQPAKKRTWV